MPAGLYRILFALYLGQGMLGGLLALALPTAMRERGAAAETIGLIYLSMLPWLLKVIWARRIDRHGRWRDWIVPLQAGYVIAFAALAAVGLLAQTAFLYGVGLALFALSMLMAIQDTAIDGFAVARTPSSHRGVVNGLLLASASLGALIGGGATLILLPRAGWTAAVMLLAVLMAGIWWVVRTMESPLSSSATLPPAALPGTSGPVKSKPAHRRHGAGPGLHRLAFAAAFIVAQRFALVMIGPYLIDRSLALATVGWLQGIGGTVAALAAALACTLLLRRAPLPPVMGALIAAQTAGWAAITWTAATGPATSASIAAGLAILLSALTAAAFAVFYALVMGWCRRDRPATDFAMVQSLDSALAIGCAVLGGRIVSLEGYVPLFAATTTLLLVVGPWAWFARRDLFAPAAAPEAPR